MHSARVYGALSQRFDGLHSSSAMEILLIGNGQLGEWTSSR
jgi:hypothetical protein